jgi:4-hydroxythreonine-4-phosphate dehydrogenase
MAAKLARMRAARNTTRVNHARCVIIAPVSPTPDTDNADNDNNAEQPPAHTPPRPRRLLALADDLTGAAEVAAVLMSPARRCEVLLGPGPGPGSGPGRGSDVTDVTDVTVVDLDSRYLPPATAATRVSAVLSATKRDAPDAVVLKKADSLLRGNLAAELGALGPGVVVATALPALGRVVRSGVLHLGGVPLHETDAWRAETAPPPRSLAQALAPHPVELVPLATVRASRPTLIAALREAATACGAFAICDAETDADLDAIAAAALAIAPAPRLAGSGGLAAALARALGAPAPAAWHPGPPTRPVLVVVGTAEPSAAEQARRLIGDGAAHLPLPVTALRDPTTPPLIPLPTSGTTVLTLTPDDPGTDPATDGARRGLAQRLATAVAQALAADGGERVALALTGGETARRVLDALSVTRLTPFGQIHHGAVLSATPAGRLVVTRPGSYGDADSLRHIAHALTRAPATPDLDSAREREAQP